MVELVAASLGFGGPPGLTFGLGLKAGLKFMEPLTMNVR